MARLPFIFTKGGASEIMTARGVEYVPSVHFELAVEVVAEAVVESFGGGVERADSVAVFAFVIGEEVVPAMVDELPEARGAKANALRLGATELVLSVPNQDAADCESVVVQECQ
jgi:hypothetical protein